MSSKVAALFYISMSFSTSLSTLAFVCFYLIFIRLQLIHNAVLVSAVQQSDSVIHRSTLS